MHAAFVCFLIDQYPDKEYLFIYLHSWLKYIKIHSIQGINKNEKGDKTIVPVG